MLSVILSKTVYDLFSCFLGTLKTISCLPPPGPDEGYSDDAGRPPQLPQSQKIPRAVGLLKSWLKLVLK